MIGLDTSVLVRLLVGEPVAQAEVARSRVRLAVDRDEAVVVTDLVVAETYHALHHHYGIPKDQALALLNRVLTSGVVRPEPPELPATLAGAGGGAGVVDRMIHLRHRRSGGITVTFDRQQAALEGAERLA